MTGLTGDISGDDDSDQEEFGRFQACYSDNGHYYDTGCKDTDLDRDNDVDLTDFNVFISGMAGPNVPVDTNCSP